MALTLKSLLRSAALPPALAAQVEIGAEARPEAIPAAGGLAYVSGPAAETVAAWLDRAAEKDTERRALAGEVLHLYREVHLFEQLSTELAALLDFPAVGEVALAQARRLIAASAGAVFVDGEAVVSFGEAARLAECAASLDGRGVVGDRWLGAPLRGHGAIVLQGSDYSSADLKLLNTIALQAGIALENARAVRDREQLAAIQQELETARRIQLSLVPSVFPPFPQRTDFELHAQMTAAKSVGGDFFDFFLIDEHRLGLVIGDVSGKGVPAALYMAVTRTQIKSTALAGMSPAECLLAVNAMLVRDRVSSMFATCFYAILDTRTGRLDYANAGHNPPYALRAAGGAVERFPIGGGLPLGMFAKLKCANASVALAPGDEVFLYTDGVPEATDAALNDFTDQRMEAVLREAPDAACAALIERMNQALLEFTGGAAQSDDVTMLALRYRGA